jgi:hypothetical protein
MTTGTRKTAGEVDPDEVMLNPEYIRKVRDGEDTGLGRKLSREEMKAVFENDKGIIERLFESGSNEPSVHPVFSFKEVIDAKGKRRMVPFIGISGKF